MTSRDIVMTIISVVLGGVFSYLISALFYRRQRKESNTIALERTRRAHHEILDILESYIINKEVIRIVQIKHLIESCEREYDSNLQNFVSPMTLLQDVSFRLQKSKHLNVQEKSNYAQIVEGLVNEVKQNEIDSEVFYQRYKIKSIIDDIKKGLKSNNIEKLDESLDEIENIVRGMKFHTSTNPITIPNIKVTILFLIVLAISTQALPHIIGLFEQDDIKAYRYSYAAISGITIGVMISNRLNPVFDSVFKRFIKKKSKKIIE